VYRCGKHGVHEVVQGMDDAHRALCPACGSPMQRVFTAPAVKCGSAKMGNTREELFDNLAKEGFAGKDWRQADPVYKAAKGIPDSA